MPYTAPPTFVASDPLAAAELNVLSDDIEDLEAISQGLTFSGARAYRASNLSIPDSTLTDAVLTTEAYDYGGWWASGASFTVPAGAIPAGFTTIAVLCIATVRYVANGTGNRSLYIVKNGVSEDLTSMSALTGDTTTVQLTTLLTVAAADTIKIQAWQSSGGALNLDVAKLTVVRFAPVA